MIYVTPPPRRITVSYVMGPERFSNTRAELTAPASQLGMRGKVSILPTTYQLIPR